MGGDYQRIPDTPSRTSRFSNVECLNFRSDCRKNSRVDKYWVCYKWSVIFAVAMIPIWLSVGVPMIIFGMRYTQSPYLFIPFCVTIDGQFISMNLSIEFPHCPPKENLTYLDALPINFEFRRMRSDIGYKMVFLRYQDDPLSTANVTISARREDRVLMTPSNFVLAPIMETFNNVNTSQYNASSGHLSSVQINYISAGAGIASYTYNSNYSNCHNPNKAYVIETEKSLAEDAFSNLLSFSNPVNGVEITISAVMNYTAARRPSTPVLWLGFVDSQVSNLFIFGIIIVLIPLVVICAPCLYIFSLILSCFK